jgi:hypothetical protein
LGNPYNSFANLNCSHNQINSLNFTGLHPSSVDCSFNQITAINMYGNNYLNYLDCSSNNLVSLNLVDTPYQVGEGSHFTMDCTDNPDLSCITVLDIAFADVNIFWQKDATASYATFCPTAGPTASNLILSGSSSICSGASTDISIAIAGGVSPYTVVYNNGISDVTINNYNTGAIITVTPNNSTTYTLVSVTDANNTAGVGNSGTVNITVNQNVTYYLDSDHDGFGSFAVSQTTCTGAPANYVANSLDCNDNNANAHPGALEICGDGIDNDCNGVVDENCVTTEIKPIFWNATLAALTTDITAITSPGAQMYRFEVSNGVALVGIYDISSATPNNFSLAKLSGITYGTTYSIRVAIKTGGVWGSYGNAHNVNTPALSAATIQTTKITPTFCGATIATLDTKIAANVIQNASGYRFEITTGGVTTVYDSLTYNFTLFQTGVAVAYGTTYSIRVAVKINGIYGNYGTSCTVTTPTLVANNVPTTTIQPIFCGAVLAALNTKIGAVPVFGATKARYEVTIAGGLPVVYEVAASNFMLSQSGVAVLYNTNYSIRVAAFINGVWGNYGAACTVTTPAAPARLKAKSFEVSAYPNPFETAFTIEMETASKSNVTINVYDMIGRQVETREVQAEEMANTNLGNNYAAGVYNIIVSQDENVKTIRMVKK